MALGEAGREVRPVERYIREPLLHKGNAAIVVAYTDHGKTAATPFPGVEQTSKDLKQGFSGQKVHALVADSQLRLDETGLRPQGLLKEHVDRARDTRVKDKDLTFQEWVVRQSVRDGTSLLLFDVGAVPEMVDASYQEYEEKKGGPENPYNILSGLSQDETYQAAQRSVEGREKGKGRSGLLRKLALGSIAGSGLLTAAAFTTGLKDNPQVSRRRFLSFLGASAVTGATGGTVSVSTSVQAEQPQTPKALRDTMLNGLPPVTSDEFNRSGNDLHNDDLHKVKEQIATPGVITEEIRNSPEFQRYTAYSAEVAEILSGFRNLVAADLVASYAQNEVPPEFPENVAIVMGEAHETMPENQNIAWLIEHDQERRAGIAAMLPSLEAAVRKRLGDDAVTSLREGLLTFQRRYRVHTDGTIETEHLPPSPGLQAALNGEVPKNP